MADINLTRPEKKFTVGDIIACKVISGTGDLAEFRCMLLFTLFISFHEKGFVSRQSEEESSSDS